jgi:spore germination protein GerM
MTPQRAGIIAGIVGAAAAVAWLLFVALPRWTTPAAAPTRPNAAVSPDAKQAAPKIRVRLYYLAPSGTSLQVAEREVEASDAPAIQARRIIEAQLAPPAPPLMSAIPSGTTLRNLYFDSSGIAYVDLSGEVTSAHPGGSLAEILTVYSVVNALAENLPAVSGVQILIDGREVDTLAGHVDLRRPLQKSARWTETPETPPEVPEAAQTSGTER